MSQNQHNQQNKNNKEKGISLFLAIVIVTLLVAMVLGLTTIFLTQARMFRGIDNSVVALYAADAGIERVLMRRDNPCEELVGYSTSTCSTSSRVGGATYEIFVTTSSTHPNTCQVTYYCIRSIGTFREVRRAIEINY